MREKNRFNLYDFVPLAFSNFIERAQNEFLQVSCLLNRYIEIVKLIHRMNANEITCDFITYLSL